MQQMRLTRVTGASERFDTLSSGCTSIEIITPMASIPVSQISRFSSNSLLGRTLSRNNFPIL